MEKCGKHKVFGKMENDLTKEMCGYGQTNIPVIYS